MSSIDERVVAMKFDNAQFERGAQTSMRTLSDLKKNLDFSGAHRGLSELQGTANGFNLNSVSSSVDGLAGKFGALQIAGIAALAAIGAKGAMVATQLAQNMFVQQPLEGLREYETQINAVQTIMANTASKGTTMDEINAALRELNTYADQTIYNFGEMTRNIGTFTAAGLDLDTSAAAIKGIANVAAMAGSNSQQAATAMYQLSQAMSTGTVRLQDWMSIENAGMGTEAFRNSLLETARVNGVAVDSLIEKNGSFRASLSEGWLSSEILTQTLSKFTGDMSEEQLRQMGYTAEQTAAIIAQGQLASDAATKVKTFTQLMGTLAEATASGWAQSWQLILGDFEEAKMLFTEISDILGGLIGESADARNAQLQIWKDGGGREAIIQALRNAFEGLMQIVNPIREAFQEIFPPNLGNTLLDISFAIRDFTEGLMIGADGSERLKDVFLVIFSGLKVGLDVLGVGVKFIFSIFGDLFEVLGAVGRIFEPVVEWFGSLGGEAASGGADLEHFTDELIRIKDIIVGGLIRALEWLGEAFAMLWTGDFEGLSGMFNGLFDGIFEAVAALRNGFGGVITWLETSFGDVGEKIGWAVFAIILWFGQLKDDLQGMATAVGDFFGGFGEGTQSLFEMVDPGAILAALNAGAITGVIIGFVRTMQSVKDIFDNVAGILEGVTVAFDSLTNVLDAMEARIKADIIIKIAIAVGILAASLWLIAQIPTDRLIGSVLTLAATFGILMGGMKVLDSMMDEEDTKDFTKVAVVMILMSIAVRILAGALKVLGALSWEEIARGLTALAISMGLLLVTSKIMSDSEKDILKTSAALIVFAIALAALTGVIAILGNMPMDVLVQGMVALGILMTAVAGISVVLSKLAPDVGKAAGGIIAMSIALGLLTGVVAILGNMDMKVLEQGMAVAGIMILGLVTAAVILSQLAPKMAVSAGLILAMAAALLVLTGVIAILGNMDTDTLEQGLIATAAAIGILVLAAAMLSKDIKGAGSMLLIAFAVMMIAGAITALSKIPIEGVGVALLAMAGVFTILAAAAFILGPMIKPLFMITLVILAMSVAFAIFAVSIAILAPALIMLTGAMVLFAEVSQPILEAVPAMLALGGALLIFGIGAAVAGAGAIILGVGFLLMGAGLMLLATTGFLGIYVLVQLVEQLGALGEHIPALLGFGAAFIVLGVGMALVGVGMVAIGLGVLFLATGLAVLVAVGTPAAAIITLIVMTVIQLIPIAMAAFAAGVVQFVQIIRDNIPEFIEAAKDLIIGILDGIQEVIPEIRDTIQVLLFELLDLLAESVPEFVDKGLELLTGLLDGIADNIGNVADSATDVVIEFMEAIGRNTPKIVEAGFEMLIDFIEGITDAVEDNADRVSDAGWDLAEAIIDGVVGGIGDGVDRVWTAARTMAENAFNAAMDFLDINSPSKLFRKGFQAVPEGAAMGISDGTTQVVRSVEDMGVEVYDAMLSTMAMIQHAANAEMEMSPTVRPVLDLDGIRRDASGLQGLFDANLPIQGALNTAVGIRNDTEPPDEPENPSDEGTNGDTYVFEQHNYSPKALDSGTLYRQSQNLLSKKKEEVKP